MAVTKPKGKGARTPTFSALELEHIRRDIQRVVPSEPWYEVAMGAVQRGDVKRKKDLPRELARAGIFPPGPGKRGGRSIVKTPMLPCHSRGCTAAKRSADGERIAVHRHVPFYCRAGHIVRAGVFAVRWKDAGGQTISKKFRATSLREARIEAARKGIFADRIVGIRVVLEPQRVPACDECRIAAEAQKIENLQRRAAAKEAAAGEGAADVERDFRGRQIVEEPELTPAQAAREKMMFYSGVPQFVPLPPEDDASLRAEIDAEVKRYQDLAGGTVKMLAVGFG